MTTPTSQEKSTIILREKRLQDQKHDVILVEDDEALHRVLRRQLQWAGFDVSSAYDAGAFLSKLALPRAKSLVAIVDLRLPGLNGDVAIDWISQSQDEVHKKLSLIVLTGSPELVHSGLEMASNVKHILFKPCPIEQLVSCVRDCVSPS
ncbi:MAG: response regulator [Pseudomonadota bacterium]